MFGLRAGGLAVTLPVPIDKADAARGCGCGLLLSLAVWLPAAVALLGYCR